MAEFSTSIDIEAPPEIVFAHLVDERRMVSWMGERADLQPTPGGAFAVDVNGVPFRGHYLEVDPPRRVVISWGIAGSDDLPPAASRVEFTLTATACGTALYLSHTGLPETRARTHAAGWANYLRRLQVAAAGGDPGVDSWRPATATHP
jgi:uncharacterized protein YndB with AHSA1/START domain